MNDKQKPAFIAAAEEEMWERHACLSAKSVSLRELDSKIGRPATDALVSACGGFHLPVPSPGQKCEIAVTLRRLIGHEAAETLIYTYANLRIYIPAGRA